MKGDTRSHVGGFALQLFGLDQRSAYRNTVALGFDQGATTNAKVLASSVNLCCGARGGSHEVDLIQASEIVTSIFPRVALE
jgi:hypothetical protein